MRDERDEAYSAVEKSRADVGEASIRVESSSSPWSSSSPPSQSFVKAVIDTFREEIKGAEQSASRLCEPVNVAAPETVPGGTDAAPASVFAGTVASVFITPTPQEETSTADAPPVVQAAPSGTPGQGLVQRVTGAMKLARIKRFG